MKKWYKEDWQFTISTQSVGKKNRAEECRIGLEAGDTFTCEYSTPGDFCPTAFCKIFPALEVMRCEGDLRLFGAQKTNEVNISCPDGVVTFRVVGKKVK
jgi:uncharacterized repeat protein (TIGR04076 family)